MDARLFGLALKVYAEAHGCAVEDIDRDATAAQDMPSVLAIARLIEEDMLA